MGFLLKFLEPADVSRSRAPTLPGPNRSVPTTKPQPQGVTRAPVSCRACPRFLRLAASLPAGGLSKDRFRQPFGTFFAGELYSLRRLAIGKGSLRMRCCSQERSVYFPRLVPISFLLFWGALCFPLTRQKRKSNTCWCPNSSLVYSSIGWVVSCLMPCVARHRSPPSSQSLGRFQAGC